MAAVEHVAHKDFEPHMTLYLTDNTTPDEIKKVWGLEAGTDTTEESTVLAFGWLTVLLRAPRPKTPK